MCEGCRMFCGEDNLKCMCCITGQACLLERNLRFVIELMLNRNLAGNGMLVLTFAVEGELVF